MYLSYDTEGFDSKDYQAFEHISGFSVRESRGRNDHYRGTVISVNTLVVSKDRIAECIPEGYLITESPFPQSAGKIVKQPDAMPQRDIPCNVEEKAVLAVKRELANPEGGGTGTKRAVSVLNELIQNGLIKDSVSQCISLIEEQAAAEGYQYTNIFEIYQAVPSLRKLYFETKRHQDYIQNTLNKIAVGQMSLKEIPKVFDRIYLKGICRYLGISAAES